ncbi:MAG: dihydrofolate reductase family protein [Micromonosporaceae bacterium]|nr:dihydrofolate reductase family protein [Micromonosporaceae bacterium]
MTDRPYTLLSCAMSIDGYVDDASDQPMVFSNDANTERVDEVRASCDAILVGANTIWRNNPRLAVWSSVLRDERVAKGLAPSPMKVAVTARGDIDPALRFFEDPDIAKIVYCTAPAIEKAKERFGNAATVVDAGDPIGLPRMLSDLAERGVRRLLVEGGGAIQTQLLGEGLADELQLVIAPSLVGDPRAPRFVDDGTFPASRNGRGIRLGEARQMGNLVLLRYALSDRFIDQFYGW